MMINQCAVNVLNGELPADEVSRYVERGREKYGKRLKGMNITVDGEFVELCYKLDPIVPQEPERRY